MSTPEIFVSYAWKGESEALVNQLCQAFAAKGYQITRDKSAMTYKDSIKNFMDSIGRGKFIIAVVSDKYMKSEYCMYEAYRMFQSPAFGERVFPIVLPDADVFSFRGQAAYLKYWTAEYKSLETEYKEIANISPTMVAPLTERLRDLEATTRFINDFMAAVGDMNVLTSQMHLESNFSALIQAIETRIKAVDSAAASSEDGKNNSSSDHSIGSDQPVIKDSQGHAAHFVKQDRIFDSGIPRKVYVDITTQLMVMIRRVGSRGLAAFLEISDNEVISVEDVKSRPLSLEFPVLQDGTTAAIQVLLKVFSPDFEPHSQEVTILVPPDSDSEVHSLLLKPIRAGGLLVSLEIYRENNNLGNKTLKIDSVQGEAIHQPYIIFSIPINSYVKNQGETSVGNDMRTINGRGDRDGAKAPIQELIMKDERKIDTGGGAYIAGSVNTGGGDFVGHDKKVSGNETNIKIGGNVSGSNIVVGNNNIVTNSISTQNIFAPVYQAIEQSARSVQEKEDLKAEFQEIETAVAKGEAVDESWLSRRLRNLKKIAPDIAEVALSSLAGPGAAVAMIVKKVAERVKAEG